MICNTKTAALVLSAAALIFLTGCNAEKSDKLTAMPLAAHINAVETIAPLPSPTEYIRPWTDKELAAMAQTLSGECYDDKELDKRRVCEVILNRVSDGHFGNSICDVITSKNQFVGYWNPSRAVSENDLYIAEQTLRDWYDNDCKAFSEYLYFSAGKNRENTFYKNID